jgi:DNA repair protein RadC
MARVGKHLGIKDWALEDRPREKLLSKGIASLSNAELIAILIGSGTKDETAVELSRKVLDGISNNLVELGKLSITDLQKIKGIGEAKAISIIAAMELGRRRSLSAVEIKKKIEASQDVFDYFHPLIADLHHEEFWILLLNRANIIIDRYKGSQGGVSGTVMDVKTILKFAIEKLASAIIVCHNHPSGNKFPSDSDKSITRKLSDAANILDIKLLDHLIVTSNGYYSFADEGLM